MRIILLILVAGICYSIEFGDTKPEDFDYQKYISDGQTTYDQHDRIKESLVVLNSKIDELLKSYRSRIDESAKKLLDESQIKWNDYAMSRSTFIADQYRGGTLAGVVHGSTFVAMTRMRLLDLISYEKIYFGP